MENLKASDLRIGNLVKFGDNICKVIEITTIAFYVIDEKGETYKNTWAELEPIQITEDLLLKLGGIKLYFKDFPSFNLLGIQINFINGMWIEHVSKVEIQGLHHLQNIFYFRNSEELEIKQ